jgi:NADP-dependent 3-hydroxy acid dehydrogenase YdfG
VACRRRKAAVAISATRGPLSKGATVARAVVVTGARGGIGRAGAVEFGKSAAANAIIGQFAAMLDRARDAHTR